MKSLNHRLGEQFILHEFFDKYQTLCDYQDLGGKVQVRQVIRIL
jgi:hypothetical protein